MNPSAATPNTPRAMGLRWGKVFAGLRLMEAAALEAVQSR